MRKDKYEGVLKELQFVTFIDGKAKFTGEKEIEVNNENLSADKFIIATGSTANVPPIKNIEEVGNYGIKPYFDDGHDTGIFSWEYLYELGSKMNEKWNEYLDSLKKAGYERDNSG